MESASFSDRAQMLLRDHALSIGADSTSSLSLPVAVPAPQPGGQPLDAVFLYSEIPGEGRPFAWALFGASTGNLVSFSRCEYSDFLPTRDYPLDMPVALKTPRLLPPSQIAEGRREMFVLYERLRVFLLQPSLSEDQMEIRGKYATLFEAYAYLDHRAFYKALSPAFIEWLGLGWDGPTTLPDKHSETKGGEDVGALRELRELFVHKIQTDAHKQRLFDDMHAELVRYKNDLLGSLTRPLEGDVIKTIEDIDKSMEIYRSRQFTPDNYRRLLALFEGVRIDLSDLLYRNGVEPYSSGGKNVDITRQKIIDTLPTDKKRLDKKVAIRHAQGWEKNGKIIRPERISVYVYQPEGEQEETSDS